MTTSGTTSFAPEIGDLLEEAASRAGIELRSGYDYQSAARSLNLLLTDMANRGLNLFSVDNSTLSITAGNGQYNLPADTVDVIAMMIRDGNNIDYNIERIGVGTWANIANKTIQARPVQAWVERLRDQPRINLWPVPNANFTLAYWRMRRLQDAGSPHNTPDVPFRFWPALTSGLAYYLAMKGADLQRISFLKAAFEEDLTRATLEDRGRESFFIGIWTGR